VAIFLNLLTDGLLVGVIYSLVALGFVVAYKAMSVFDFVQGEFVMYGGLTATAMQYCGGKRLDGLYSPIRRRGIQQISPPSWAS